MQTETLPQFQFPRIAPRSLINFCARIGRIPLRPVLSSRNPQQDVAWIIHERKSFGVSSRVEGPLYSKDSSPVSFFYRGPSTPRPPDPGSPARAAFARDGVASRKRSGSEVRRGRFAQDDISKFMNNPALGLRMA